MTSHNKIVLAGKHTGATGAIEGPVNKFKPIFHVILWQFSSPNTGS